MVTPAIELASTAALAGQDGQTGHGVYLLTHATEHVGPSGTPHLNLTLEDATGRTTGYGWPEHRASIAYSTLPCPVTLCAEVKVRDGHPGLKVHSLAPLPVSEVACATALLPRMRCPDVALPALERLTQLERDLPPPLDGFLREVLLDPQVTLPFCAAVQAPVTTMPSSAACWCTAPRCWTPLTRAPTASFPKINGRRTLPNSPTCCMTSASSDRWAKPTAEPTRSPSTTRS